MNDLDPLSPQSPDSQRRLLVALALAMALTFAYTYFFSPKGPPPGAESTDAGVAAVTDGGTAPVAAVTPNLRHLEWFHDHARIEQLLFDGANDPVDGQLPVPQGPGHGLSLRYDVYDTYRVA